MNVRSNFYEPAVLSPGKYTEQEAGQPSVVLVMAD